MKISECETPLRAEIIISDYRGIHTFTPEKLFNELASLRQERDALKARVEELEDAYTDAKRRLSHSFPIKDGE